MNILSNLEYLEDELGEQAKGKNPPYLEGARVSKVIETVPNILYGESCYREQHAGYSWMPVEVKEFENKQGLCYRGNNVANFFYKIVEMSIVLAETDIESYKGYRMKIKGYVYQGGRETIYEINNVSKEELESLEFLKRVPYAVCSSKVAKNDFKNILYCYVNYLVAEFNGKTKYVTRSTGWINFRGQKVYVDSEKALGFPELPIHAIGGMRIKNTDSIKNLWEQFQLMRSVIKEKGSMEVLLLYVLMSFLFTLFQEAGRTIKHCMFIMGQRATRKTALALCFTQIENKDFPEYNFLATESGIQAHFQDYHDSCIFIDDLAPTCNPSKRRVSEQKLEMIIRLFGDAGKRVINTTFATAAAQNLDYSIKGGCIVTGEYFYSAGVESSIARTVVIELEKDSVNLELLTYFQHHPEVLETLLYRFLIFVTRHWEECKASIKKVVESYRRKYQHQYSNGRYADYLGQYMATAYMLIDFLKEDSGVDEFQGNKLYGQIEEEVVCFLTANDRKMKSRAPINTLLMSIAYMAEIGKIVTWGEKLPAEIACLIETDTAFYLRQKDLPDILKLYCSKTGEPYIQMSSQELGKLLKQSEVCTVYYEGGEERLSKKYPKDYDNIRLMEISKAVLVDKVGILMNR